MMFVGGGHGLSYTIGAIGDRDDNIIVVSSFDSGGDTGIIRQKYGGIAIGDAKKIILALRSELKNTDFITKIGGHKYWNEIIFEMINKYGANNGMDILREMLNIKSQIYFVSTEPSTLYAKTYDGKILTGESTIERCNELIDYVWLDPKVSLNSAIPKEKCVVITPGSLYGSLISNLLVNGFQERISDSYKVLIVNGKKDQETKKINSLEDYVNEFKKYGFEPDLVVVPSDGDFKGNADIVIKSKNGIYDQNELKKFIGELYENCNRF